MRFGSGVPPKESSTFVGAEVGVGVKPILVLADPVVSDSANLVNGFLLDELLPVLVDLGVLRPLFLLHFLVNSEGVKGSLFHLLRPQLERLIVSDFLALCSFESVDLQRFQDLHFENVLPVLD